MSKSIRIGNRHIGNGAPILIQSMCNIPLSEYDLLLEQALKLEKCGCDILRISVPDSSDAVNFGKIKSRLNIPLVADIHFDMKAALAAIDNGADKIRINPGNMPEKNIKEIVEACRKNDIPIRVGVNSGSINKDILSRYGHTAKALCESAKESVKLLLKEDFDDIVVSMKASDVRMTVDSYRLFYNDEEFKKMGVDLPLHVGVTEAGTLKGGVIKSSIGIGALLLDGIGDTIRVSLTADPVEEVLAGKTILRSLGLYDKGIDLISCPTCGRTTVDVFKLTDFVEKRFADLEKPVKVAVMGCVVNGPGEADSADIGVTGVNGTYVLFKKGKVYMKDISETDIYTVLEKEINEIASSK